MKTLFVLLLIYFNVGFEESRILHFVAVNQQEGKIHFEVDEHPEFPGGEKELRNYLKNNVKFPREATIAKVNGRVVTKFIVEADGTVSNIRVLKGLGHGCDEETVRVLKSMPKWKPGKVKNGAVRTYFTIPVSFLVSNR